MRENELVEEGEIVLMCASLLIRGEVSLRETKMESGQMCSPRFSVFNSFQTFISYSLSTRIYFIALILLVLWAQITPNMEDWLL